VEGFLVRKPYLLELVLRNLKYTMVVVVIAIATFSSLPSAKDRTESTQRTILPRSDHVTIDRSLLSDPLDNHDHLLNGLYEAKKEELAKILQEPQQDSQDAKIIMSELKKLVHQLNKNRKFFAYQRLKNDILMQVSNQEEYLNAALTIIAKRNDEEVMIFAAEMLARSYPSANAEMIIEATKNLSESMLQIEVPKLNQIPSSKLQVKQKALEILMGSFLENQPTQEIRDLLPEILTELSVPMEKEMSGIVTNYTDPIIYAVFHALKERLSPNEIKDIIEEYIPFLHHEEAYYD